jgi:hypothetical protein
MNRLPCPASRVDRIRIQFNAGNAEQPEAGRGLTASRVSAGMGFGDGPPERAVRRGGSSCHEGPTGQVNLLVKRTARAFRHWNDAAVHASERRRVAAVSGGGS